MSGPHTTLLTPEQRHGSAGARRTLEGLGAMSGPPTTLLTPEQRHGSAGALRTLGVWGPCRGPDTTLSTLEKRHGSAGALRTFGGLGAMSGPPCQQFDNQTWRVPHCAPLATRALGGSTMGHDHEHVLLATLKRQLVDRQIDRREFLRYATFLGMAAPAAYALAGRITGEA